MKPERLVIIHIVEYQAAIMKDVQWHLFEFDIEQDALRKPLLIKQETEWNKLDDLAPFC